MILKKLQIAKPNMKVGSKKENPHDFSSFKKRKYKHNTPSEIIIPSQYDLWTSSLQNKCQYFEWNHVYGYSPKEFFFNNADNTSTVNSKSEKMCMTVSHIYNTVQAVRNTEFKYIHTSFSCTEWKSFRVWSPSSFKITWFIKVDASIHFFCELTKPFDHLVLW